MVHECGPLPECRIVLPSRIRGVLGVAVRQNSLRVLEPRGFEDRPDRAGYAVEQMNRLPADLRHLLDRLGGELRGRHVEQDVGT